MDEQAHAAALLHGTLAYTGMTVLGPFIAYAADSVDDETLAGYLASLRDRLALLQHEAGSLGDERTA